MAVSTIVTTVGAADANSYVTLAYANQYHANRSNTTDWTAETDDDVLNRCLLQATIDMEMLRYRGTKYDISLDGDGDAVQALAFPRTWNTDTNGLYIPRPVEWAQCEQALFLYWLNASSVEADDKNNIESFRRGGVSVTYREPKNEASPTYGFLSKKAVILLTDLLLSGSGGLKLRR